MLLSTCACACGFYPTHHILINLLSMKYFHSYGTSRLITILFNEFNQLKINDACTWVTRSSFLWHSEIQRPKAMSMNHICPVYLIRFRGKYVSDTMRYKVSTTSSVIIIVNLFDLNGVIPRKAPIMLFTHFTHFTKRMKTYLFYCEKMVYIFYRSLYWWHCAFFILLMDGWRDSDVFVWGGETFFVEVIIVWWFHSTHWPREM